MCVRACVCMCVRVCACVWEVCAVVAAAPPPNSESEKKGVSHKNFHICFKLFVKYVFNLVQMFAKRYIIVVYLRINVTKSRFLLLFDSKFCEKKMKRSIFEEADSCVRARGFGHIEHITNFHTHANMHCMFLYSVSNSKFCIEMLAHNCTFLSIDSCLVLHPIGETKLPFGLFWITISFLNYFLMISMDRFHQTTYHRDRDGILETIILFGPWPT